MWAHLKTETPLENCWQPHFWNPSCRTRPRKGHWHCSKEQSSYAQATLVAHLLWWCSDTPLDKIQCMRQNRVSLPVKEREFTETPDCDFTNGGGNLTESTKSWHLKNEATIVFGAISFLSPTSHVSLLILNPRLVARYLSTSTSTSNSSNWLSTDDQQAFTNAYLCSFVWILRLVQPFNDLVYLSSPSV